VQWFIPARDVLANGVEVRAHISELRTGAIEAVCKLTLLERVVDAL
jgi:hypothetical protein